MTTATLRPNAVGTLGQSGVTATGAATVWQAWSDNSDSSYASYPANSFAYASAELGTTTLNALAWTVSLTLRMRACLVNIGDPATAMGMTVSKYDTTIGDYVIVAQGIYTVASTFITTATVTTAAVTLTQAEVASLVVTIDQRHAANAAAVYVFEAYVDLVSAEAPVVDVTGPSGTIATSTPTVTWTYTAGSGGGPQTAFGVKIFSAAQYGAGGFQPGSSDPTYTAGVVAGPQTAFTIPAQVLANSTTYRAYAVAAQLVNGVARWGAWDYSGFDTSFAAAIVASTTAAASNSGGYIEVTVARQTSGANTAWQKVTIQRSVDAGVTWEDLRGGVETTGTNTFVNTWGANTVIIRDYETGNGEAALYRAAAFTNASGSDVWGTWVLSSSTSWTSSDYWLKNPHDPADNTSLVRPVLTGMRRTRNPNIVDIENRANPIVISGATLHSIAGTGEFRTLTQAATQAFESLVENGSVVLVQVPAGDKWGSRYIGGLEIVDNRVVETAHGRWETIWEVSFVEVDAPEDETS